MNFLDWYLVGFWICAGISGISIFPPIDWPLKPDYSSLWTFTFGDFSLFKSIECFSIGYMFDYSYQLMTMLFKIY